MHRRASSLLAVVLHLVPGEAPAVTCVVPSATHPSVTAAISDLGCDTIDLGTGIFTGRLLVARTLSIVGDGTVQSILAGPLIASGAGTVVTLAALRIDGTQPSSSGCAGPSLVALGGARIVTQVETLVTDTATDSGTCGLFSDGFESGNTAEWSQTSP